jgi:malonyl-CoA O-methyltransferase
MSIKDVIERNFSRSAEKYEAYCDVQNYAAKNLIKLAEGQDVSSILDIGCGPGNYTRLLREKFAKAAITGIDISGQMISIAKSRGIDGDIKFIKGDIETAEFVQKFDLVTSNASLQWLGDFEGAVGKFKKMLSEKGYTLFSLFGQGTFKELNFALKAIDCENLIMSQSFASRDAIERALKQNFGQVHVTEEFLKKEYGSLLEFLNVIKYTGTRGVGLKGKSLNKGDISRVESIYKKKFGSIIVTYQIFYCMAKG